MQASAPESRTYSSEALRRREAGRSGASLIGVSTIMGLEGSDEVQAALEGLAGQIRGIGGDHRHDDIYYTTTDVDNLLAQHYDKAETDGRYVNESDHTKAAHDALGVDAATVGGSHPSAFVPVSSLGVTVAQLVGGLVPTSQLPANRMQDIHDASSEAEMLALNADRGDLCRRWDISATFGLNADDPAVASNWKELPIRPDVIQSINGQTGAVVLSAADVGALTELQGDGRYIMESERTEFTPASHLVESDPHPQYLTLQEGNGLYFSGVEDQGVAETFRGKINFTGAGVTVQDDGANGRLNVDIPGGGGGGSGAAIQDEDATPFATRPTLRFVGEGVTATEDAANNRINVSVPGGAGGEQINASETQKGVSRTSVAPSDPADPVVAGSNDPRIPTPDENNALQGTSGAPSGTNRFVTNEDTRLGKLAGHVVRDEGTARTQRAAIDFRGDGVSVADDSTNDKTVVTILGGSGSAIGSGRMWLLPGDTTDGTGEWLSLNGRLLNRTTHSTLFALWGTRYGSGDGSTTFGIPNLSGRTAVQEGQGSGLTNRSLGQTPGTETHTLTREQLPSFKLKTPINEISNTTTGGGAPRFNSSLGANATQNAESETVGSGQSHENMQPSFVVNYQARTR